MPTRFSRASARLSSSPSLHSTAQSAQQTRQGRSARSSAACHRRCSCARLCTQAKLFCAVPLLLCIAACCICAASVKLASLLTGARAADTATEARSAKGGQLACQGDRQCWLRQACRPWTGQRARPQTPGRLCSRTCSSHAQRCHYLQLCSKRAASMSSSCLCQKGSKATAAREGHMQSMTEAHSVCQTPQDCTLPSGYCTRAHASVSSAEG